MLAQVVKSTIQTAYYLNAMTLGNHSSQNSLYSGQSEAALYLPLAAVVKSLMSTKI